MTLSHSAGTELYWDVFCWLFISGRILEVFPQGWGGEEGTSLEKVFCMKKRKRQGGLYSYPCIPAFPNILFRQLIFNTTYYGSCSIERNRTQKDSGKRRGNVKKAAFLYSYNSPLLKNSRFIFSFFLFHFEFLSVHAAVLFRFSRAFYNKILLFRNGIY